MRAQAQVLPAEGDDARVLRRAGRHGQAAGLPAGAEDRVARGDLGALQAHRAVVARDAR